MIRIPFGAPEEKATIISDNEALGHRCVGEENLFVGNFLVFDLVSEIEEREDLAQIEKKIGKALFLHENRIRVLEGKAPITKEQFITALKAL